MALYPLAFPDENLAPLVAALLNSTYQTLSLGAFDDDGLLGHALFTHTVSGKGALLGPLAVHPKNQKQGAGSQLIQAGFAALKAQGIAQVFVLGDPKYYTRLGFAPETSVEPAYPMKKEWMPAWQSRILANRAPLKAGPISLPTPWLDPALWS